MGHVRTETEYQRLNKQTQKLLDDLKQALGGLPSEARGQWDDRLAGLDSDIHTPLRLAIAGEYNVGKSTLIKALSGAEVAISADITTNRITSYKFDDIELLDMPGTLSGLNEHDQMAMRAVLDSDLLLFVVTNELFNAQSIKYFNKAVEELKKAKQCMLVVNQFDRVNLRDRTPEEAMSVMTEALQEMVKPASVYDFRPVFVSARDYCDAMKQTDTGLKDELTRWSRMDTLREALNEFCREKGLYGRFARPIQVMLSVASECLQSYCSDSEDEQMSVNYLQRREQILLQELAVWRDKTRNLCENVRHRIRQCAEPVLTTVEQKLAAQEVDSIYDEANSNIERIVEKTEDEIASLCDITLRTIDARLGELNKTPVGKRIMRTSVDLPDGAEKPKAPNVSKPPSQTVVSALASAMRKAGEKLASNSGKMGKEAAEKLRILIKYKPWGKIKMAEDIAKYLGRTGKVLGPLAIALEVYINYRQERAKDKEEQERLQYKATIRGNFVSYGDAVFEAVSQSLAGFEDAVLKSELDRVSQERFKLEQQSHKARELGELLAGVSQRAQKLLQQIPA